MAVFRNLVVYIFKPLPQCYKKLILQQLTLVDIEVVGCMLMPVGTGCDPDSLVVNDSFDDFLAMSNQVDLDSLHARMDDQKIHDMPSLVLSFMKNK